ncbi:hypothetical protein [Caballeronia sp. LZ001]|uniref:hypothetical protein n=1 Tax=Caballeronia sp. LZ001 TaxID=3038553 RepID=UPI00285B0D4E|nr:hypothetical protein [Caballeronia sp. LZ001]MDR5801150.1 hypothetical protein [Caballeronia sp. LZ001]
MTDNDKTAEKAFDAFSNRYDHESNDWLDMDVQTFFQEGFKSALESRVLAQRKPIYQARTIGSRFADTWTDQSKDGFDHMAKYPACFEPRVVFTRPAPDDAKTLKALILARQCMVDNGLDQTKVPRVFEKIDAAITRAMQDERASEEGEKS